MKSGTWSELQSLEEGLHVCQLAENESFDRFLDILNKPRENKRFEKTIRTYRIKRVELEKAAF